MITSIGFIFDSNDGREQEKRRKVAEKLCTDAENRYGRMKKRIGRSYKDMKGRNVKETDRK